MAHAQMSSMSAVSCSVRETLILALQQGRLTAGVYQSGKLLQIDPCGVMMCVLPHNMERDATLQMHYTLIQAYCWENHIGVIKVDSREKLCQLLSEASTYRQGRSAALHFQPPSISDCNCILVQYPTEACTDAELDVLEFCKVTCDASPIPVIPLNDEPET